MASIWKRRGRCSSTVSACSPTSLDSRPGPFSHRHGSWGTCASTKRPSWDFSTWSASSRSNPCPAKRCLSQPGRGTVVAGPGSVTLVTGSDRCIGGRIGASRPWRFTRATWRGVSGRRSFGSFGSSSRAGMSRPHRAGCSSRVMLKWMLDAVMESRARQLIAHVEPWLPTEGRLLDLGSGTGHLSARLQRERGLEVVTADVSDIHVVGPPPVLVADGVLPFEDNTFSAALLFFMLAYPNAPADVLAEAARVTRG